MTRILIVSARFYADISAELERGAVRALERAGAHHTLVAVPGALEIPAAIAIANVHGKFDGYVALGCVIRGETSHYETVCNESARGLMDLGVQHHLAIGNGILTVENDDQAWARAREGDKGGAAAQACLDLIAIRRHFSKKDA